MSNKPDKPIAIDDSTFDKFVSEYPVAMVDCWAPWCGPCRIVAPIIETLAKEYTGRVAFGKLNTDENPETSNKYGIQAIPTLLVLKNGKLVDAIVGAVPKARIEAVLSKHL